MKKKALAFLLLLAASAPAWSQQQPSFIDEMRLCTHRSVVFTQLAIAADQTKDADKPAYIAMLEQLIGEQQSPYARAEIGKLGEMAWSARHSNLDADAMKVYDECVDSTGSKI